MTNTILTHRVRLHTPTTTRWVLYNSKTGHQVAVVSNYAHEPEVETPYMVEWSNFYVSVPIQGMNGWTIECKTWPKVIKIASRECSTAGKLYNRLITMPIAFLKGKLS